MTKMADAAALERDSAKRAEMYLELQKVHQATSPFVIMFQQIEVAAVRADTKGFIIGPSFVDNPYAKVTKEEAMPKGTIRSDHSSGQPIARPERPSEGTK